MERRGYDSGVFHGGCRAEMGFQIALMHSVPIYMPLYATYRLHRGEEERGAERATGEERRAIATEGGDTMIEEVGSEVEVGEERR